MSAAAAQAHAEPAARPEVLLGLHMARWLRKRYGAAAESMLPACYKRARTSGEALQVSTVDMAKAWLVFVKDAG